MRVALDAQSDVDAPTAATMARRMMTTLPRIKQLRIAMMMTVKVVKIKQWRRQPPQRGVEDFFKHEANSSK